MAADGDPEPDEELDNLELEPEADLEDEGTEADEQDSSREDQVDDRTDVAAKDKDPETPQSQERQPSRSESRIRSLTEESRQAKQELAETRRRLDELSRQMAQPRPQQETVAQRAERFSMMTPQEQIAETLRESEQRHAASMNQMQMQMLDTADRTAFQARAASDPLYAKWGPKVEGKLAEMRAKGQNVERDVLLKFMIGEAALERRSSKEAKTEVRQAQRRVNAQRTRPTNSGSDTQAQRRTGSSVERRLENVQI